MMKQLFVLAVVALLGVGMGVAEDFDPEPIIQGRQAGLRDIGAAFKAISDELKTSAPVLATIRQNAQQIEALTSQQKFWFPVGTGPDSDIETQARPEIWQFAAEFKARQDAFSQEARKLTQISEGGDVIAIRTQWRELGKICKSCHEKFREEDD
jgi:cytochrome c556